MPSSQPSNPRAGEILERDSGEVPELLRESLREELREPPEGNPESRSLTRGANTDQYIQLAKTLLVMGYSKRQVAVMVQQRFAAHSMTEHTAKRVVSAARGLLQRICDKPPALVAGEACETYLFVIRNTWQEVTSQTEVVKRLDRQLEICNQDLQELRAGRPLVHRNGSQAIMRGGNLKAILMEEKDDIQADIRQALQRKAVAIKQLMDARQALNTMMGTPSRRPENQESGLQNNASNQAGGKKSRRLAGDDNPATIDETFTQLQGLLDKVATRLIEDEEAE